LYKYPLEYVYDIISIWYESVGVSSKGSQINPILSKDIDLFYHGERLIHINDLKRRDRMRLKFLLKRRSCHSIVEKNNVVPELFTGIRILLHDEQKTEV